MKTIYNDANQITRKRRMGLVFTVKFHGDLNFFLKDENIGNRNEYTFSRISSIKDVIESRGVPHTEVGRIMRGRKLVDFSFLPSTGEFFDIYPPLPPLDVTMPSIVRPEPLDAIAFVADVNVGKLARLLRIAGFDTAGRNNWTDSYISDLASEEKRIVLTKDRDLLKRKVIDYGRLVREIDPWNQLREVISFFGLKGDIKPFSRCPVCNGILIEVPKEDIQDHLLPLTRMFYDRFKICQDCDRIYWSGTHQEKFLKKIENFL